MFVVVFYKFLKEDFANGTGTHMKANMGSVHPNTVKDRSLSYQILNILFPGAKIILLWMCF